MHICVPIPQPDSFLLRQGHGNLLALHFFILGTTNILSFGLAYNTFELHKWKYHIRFCVLEFLRSHQYNMIISEFLIPHMRLHCLSQLHFAQLFPPDWDQWDWTQPCKCAVSKAWWCFLTLRIVLGDRKKGRQRKSSMEYFQGGKYNVLRCNPDEPVALLLLLSMLRSYFHCCSTTQLAGQAQCSTGSKQYSLYMVSAR